MKNSEKKKNIKELKNLNHLGNVKLNGIIKLNERKNFRKYQKLLLKPSFQTGFLLCIVISSSVRRFFHFSKIVSLS